MGTTTPSISKRGWLTTSPAFFQPRETKYSGEWSVCTYYRAEVPARGKTKPHSRLIHHHGAFACCFKFPSQPGKYQCLCRRLICWYVPDDRKALRAMESLLTMQFLHPLFILRPLRAMQGVISGLVKQADVQQGPWLRWCMGDREAVGVREVCAFTYMEHNDLTRSVGVSFAVHQRLVAIPFRLRQVPEVGSRTFCADSVVVSVDDVALPGGSSTWVVALSAANPGKAAARAIPITRSFPALFIPVAFRTLADRRVGSVSLSQVWQRQITVDNRGFAATNR